MPDAELVAACDTANGDPATTLDLVKEVTHNRRQRDDCAARMVGVAKWRTDALARAKASQDAPAVVK